MDVTARRPASVCAQRHRFGLCNTHRRLDGKVVGGLFGGVRAILAGSDTHLPRLSHAVKLLEQNNQIARSRNEATRSCIGPVRIWRRNRYSVEGTCTDCPAGYVQPSANASGCQPCTNGTVALSQGLSECQTCPAGANTVLLFHTFAKHALAMCLVRR